MTLEKIIENLEKKQDAELSKFEKRIQRIQQTIVDMSIATAIQDIKDPITYDRVFGQILTSSGYYNEINNFINTSYDVIYKDIGAMLSLGGIPITFDNKDLTKIASIKQMHFDRFSELSNATINTMKQEIFKYSLSNATSETIVAGIRNTLEQSDLAKYSGTYATTLISEYSQSIIDLKAQDTINGVWIYKGVLDAKTRPFCSCLLNKQGYYTDEQKSILQADNRRRWNCRHIFLKVTEDYAIERGYDKGEMSC